jgi:hypothetical protein
MDRIRCTRGHTGCTNLALRRSSVPIRPVRFHRILAFHSPPRIIVSSLTNTLLTTGQTVDLGPCVHRGLAHAHTLPPATASGLRARGECPEPLSAPGYPATLHIRRVLAPTRGLPAHSIPHRVRSLAPYLAVRFHQTVAYHPPPSVVNRAPATSLRSSRAPSWQTGCLPCLLPKTSVCSAARMPAP